MIDSKGRFLTQSLFLELGYNPDSLYTLKDVDHYHNDRWYISPKRIYLEMMDATEYEFANTVFCSWSHWQKICNNKILREQVDEWRNELALKLQSKAVQSLIKQSDKGSFQASKWLADHGWEDRTAGRPSKEEIQKQIALKTRDENEFTADVIRMNKNGTMA